MTEFKVNGEESLKINGISVTKNAQLCDLFGQCIKMFNCLSSSIFVLHLFKISVHDER